MDLFKMFPDDHTAREWFKSIGGRMAGSVRFAGLLKLSAAKMRSHCLIVARRVGGNSVLRLVQSGIEARSRATMGYRHIPDDHQSERRVKHETAPQAGYQSNCRLEGGAEDTHWLGQREKENGRRC